MVGVGGCCWGLPGTAGDGVGEVCSQGGGEGGEELRNKGLDWPFTRHSLKEEGGGDNLKSRGMCTVTLKTPHTNLDGMPVSNLSRKFG